MIIVHIGLRKAGSTSIQMFLTKNAEALRGLSIEYPLIGRQALIRHLNLSHEIRGQAGFDPSAGTVSDLKAHWRAADARVLMVSAEQLEECETAEALRFAELKREADEPILIFMIIRDLVDLMPSSYAQMVKLGGRTYSFDNFFKRRMRFRRVDYFATAQRWADAFGWESLQVRLLDRRHLLNGDLIDELLNTAGLDPADERARGLHRTTVANTAPGWRVLEATRALYTGRHDLPEDHPLADATSHTRERREELCRHAYRIGARLGWNDDRGQYMTRKQAQTSLDAYAAAIDALNTKLTVKLPTPLDLDQRSFVERDAAPDSGLIPVAELRAFYDQLGGPVLNRWRQKRRGLSTTRGSAVIASP